MADFEGSLPIKTVRDNEVKIEIVDGASGSTATKKLSIAQVGDTVSAGSNDFGIPALVKTSGGAYALAALGAGAGLKVELFDAGGDELAINADGSLNAVVTATNLDIRDLTHVSDSVKVGDGTDFLAVNADGSINAVVSATDLDIRNLSHTQDSVKVGDGTDFLAVNADGSINAVVTATDLDIRNLSHTQDSVKVGDGTDFLAISGTGEASVEITNAQAADGATAPSELVVVGGKDASGNAQQFKVSTAGELYVVPVESSSATDVLDYQTTATVGAAAVTNHDYTITNTKTIKEMEVLVGARGATKVEVGTWNGTTFVPKFVFFQQIQENYNHPLPRFSALGDGTLKIRVKITNLDGQSSDVYSTLTGIEE